MEQSADKEVFMALKNEWRRVRAAMTDVIRGVCTARYARYDETQCGGTALISRIPTAVD